MKISTMISAGFIIIPLSTSMAFAERQGHDPYANDVLNPFSIELQVVDARTLPAIHCPPVERLGGEDR